MRGRQWPYDLLQMSELESPVRHFVQLTDCQSCLYLACTNAFYLEGLDFKIEQKNNLSGYLLTCVIADSWLIWLGITYMSLSAEVNGE